MSKFTEYLKNNKTINEEIEDEEEEDIMDKAADFLNKINNNKEINKKTIPPTYYFYQLLQKF